ncbi:hypothetical protein ACI2JR_27405 [Klebsiella sp. NPDC088457]
MIVRPNVYRIKKIERSSNGLFWLVYVDVICCGGIGPKVIICDSEIEASAISVGDEVRQ